MGTLELFRRKATMQDAATATGSGTPFDVRGLSLLTMDVAISDTATVTFEASLDGATWHAVRALNLSTGDVSVSASASGLWALPLAAAMFVRARVSAYTSGTVTVIAVATREPGGLGALTA